MVDTDDDLGRLRRAVAASLPEIIVVEVESPARAREIVRGLAVLDPKRFSTEVPFDYHRSSASAVFAAVRAERGRPHESLASPLLAVIDVSENREGTAEQPSKDDEESRKFWSEMNLLREAWDALGAQVVFFLQPYHWRRFRYYADHLASWAFVKLSLVRPRAEHDIFLPSIPLVIRMTPAEARERLDVLGMQLAEAQRRGGPADPSWLRRFYLPLAEAALSVPDLGLARRFRDDALPFAKRIAASDLPRWFEINRDIEMVGGHYAAAEDFAHRLVRLGEENGSLGQQARGLFDLGDIAMHRSDHATARARFEEALVLSKSTGDTLWATRCTESLGEIALQLLDLGEASARFEEAIGSYKRLGFMAGEARCMEELGKIAFARSDHDTARRCYEQACVLYEHVGFVAGEAFCIDGIGDIAFARSERDAARAAWSQALEKYARIPDPLFIGRSHRRLARISVDDEDRRAHVEAARSAWQSIQRDDLIAQLDAEFPE